MPASLWPTACILASHVPANFMLSHMAILCQPLLWQCFGWKCWVKVRPLGSVITSKWILLWLWSLMYIDIPPVPMAYGQYSIGACDWQLFNGNCLMVDLCVLPVADFSNVLPSVKFMVCFCSYEYIEPEWHAQTINFRLYSAHNTMHSNALYKGVYTGSPGSVVTLNNLAH